MLEFEMAGLLDVIAHNSIYHYCKKHKFNIPHKACDLVSSLLSPQSSTKSQTRHFQMHLPLLHRKSHGIPKCKIKLTENNKSSPYPEPLYKYYPLNFQYLLVVKFVRLLKFFPSQNY